MNPLPAGRIVSVVCLALLSIARPVAAQDKPNVEVSGGYQLLHLWVGGDDGGSQTMSKGWYGDIAGNVTSSLGVVFQAGGNYKTETETFSFDEFVVTAMRSATSRCTSSWRHGVKWAPEQDGDTLRAVSGGRRPHLGQCRGHGNRGRSDVTSSSDGESTTKFALQAGGGVNIMFSKKIRRESRRRLPPHLR